MKKPRQPTTGVVRAFLYKYVMRYRGMALISLGLLLVVAISRMAPAYILKVAIDRFISRNDLHGLSRAALLYLLFVCLEYGCVYLQVYMTQLFGQSIISEMRLETFAHLLRLPVRYFDRTPLGKSLHYVTSDMENINEFITSGIVTSAGDILSIIGILAAMVYMSVPLTAVVMLFFLILVPVVDIFRRRFRAAFRETRESVSEMNAFMGESLAGTYVSRAFNRKEAEIAGFRIRNEHYMTAFKKVILYMSRYFPFVESIGILSILAILLSAGYMLSYGMVTFGTIVAFIEYTNRLYNPIRDLSEKYNIYQNAQSSLEKLHALHTAEAEEAVNETAGSTDVRGDIELRDIWLSYGRDGLYALKGINLRIREGEKVGIVGLTGSGKTSLINLLLGFYLPTRGEVRIGGRPLAQYSLESIRKAVGVVSQDVYIFPRTIRENLFAADGASHPETDRLIRTFSDEGTDKVITEEGGNLSEGEKQLIAIGRMIAYRPRYIILDEATSRIDRYLDQKVRTIIEDEFPAATCLVIAHRISTMVGMDRILVIHDGELVEEGSHAELFDKEGVYRHLYDIYRSGGHL